MISVGIHRTSEVREFSTGNDGTGTTPGLHGRKYEDICNNLLQGDTKLSTKHVKGKKVFERLYLISRLRQNLPFVISPLVPTFPTPALQLFLDFCVNFFPGGPSIFLVSTIRQSNLAKSMKENSGYSSHDLVRRIRF